MNKVLIIVKEPIKAAEMESDLVHRGFICLITDSNEKLDEALRRWPDISLALVDMNGAATSAWERSMWNQLHDIKLRQRLSILAIFSKMTLDKLASDLDIDDFVVEPYDLSELAARLRRVETQSHIVANSELIECGDLLIDQAKYEVSVNGKLVPLTFKEYELLKFLVSNRGHVFTRESLLNQVWGYDYYGGDRTVDVHIRRLRSKIEDSTHTFVETVRNIGYRFIDGKYLP